MRINKKSDSAVSPVVGVMLMLVVTIIIAAVVAAFAGGLASDTEKAPTAILKIEDATNNAGTLTNMTFMHVGGDKLKIKELTVIFDADKATYSYGIYDVSNKTIIDQNPIWSAGQIVEIYKSDKGLFGAVDGTIVPWSIVNNAGQIIASGKYTV